MAGIPGDHRPAIRLSEEEHLAFVRLIERETNARGRRMLVAWARPDALGPHAERVLTATFRLLWRIPPA